MFDFLKTPKLPRVKTTQGLPIDEKPYGLQKGQTFAAPHAAAEFYNGRLGLPDGYKYLGHDGDGNPVLKDPDGNLVSMFHETGDLQKIKSAGTPAWQRSDGKNEEGGLNEKGRKSYERETGGNLKAPVTESNPSGERAKRQNSFCSRMCGMKRVNTGASTAKDPDSRINKSLRKWNCKCSSLQSAIEKWSGDGLSMAPVYGALLGAGAGAVGNAVNKGDVQRVGDYLSGNGANFPYYSADALGRNMAEGAIVGAGGGLLVDVLRNAIAGHKQTPPADQEEPQAEPREFGNKVAGLGSALARGAGRAANSYNRGVRQDNLENTDNEEYTPQEELSPAAVTTAALALGGGGLLLTHKLKQLFSEQPKRRKQAEKTAMPRRLQDIPDGAGPDQIADAVMRYNQLRTLVRPSDETLKGYGLSRGAFQNSLRRITSHSQGKDRFELGQVAPNPKLHAALAGLAGLAGVGGAGYLGGLDTALAAVPIAGAGVGAAYVNAAVKREGVKRTAKLMKQYGLLNPQVLRQAYPLLGDDYRIA